MTQPAENDSCSQCAELVAEIARQGQEITRLSTRPNGQEAEMHAFLDGWFAHARNPDHLVADDAWRVRQTRGDVTIMPAEMFDQMTSTLDTPDEDAAETLRMAMRGVPSTATEREAGR